MGRQKTGQEGVVLDNSTPERLEALWWVPKGRVMGFGMDLSSKA